MTDDGKRGNEDLARLIVKDLVGIDMLLNFSENENEEAVKVIKNALDAKDRAHAEALVAVKASAQLQQRVDQEAIDSLSTENASLRKELSHLRSDGVALILNNLKAKNAELRKERDNYYDGRNEKIRELIAAHAELKVLAKKVRDSLGGGFLLGPTAMKLLGAEDKQD